MLKAIKYVIHIIGEEARLRKWLSAVKAVLLIIGYIGLSVLTLHPLLERLFPSSEVVAWVIIASLALIIFLLVVVNFMRTYHERAITESREEWTRRENLLETLYELEIKGRDLEAACKRRSSISDPVSDDDLRQINGWHGGAAYHLESKLGIEYRRRFYEHSETGEMVPDSAYDCERWIHTRRAKLKEVIGELRLPPPRLILKEAPPRGVKGISDH